jgi:hypothetical protein
MPFTLLSRRRKSLGGGAVPPFVLVVLPLLPFHVPFPFPVSLPVLVSLLNADFDSLFFFSLSL